MNCHTVVNTELMYVSTLIFVGIGSDESLIAGSLPGKFQEKTLQRTGKEGKFALVSSALCQIKLSLEMLLMYALNMQILHGMRHELFV